VALPFYTWVQPTKPLLIPNEKSHHDGLQEESAENILTDDRRWKKLYTMVQKSGHNGI
jgi:hypothetical protein